MAPELDDTQKIQLKTRTRTKTARNAATPSHVTRLLSACNLFNVLSDQSSAASASAAASFHCCKREGFVHGVPNVRVPNGSRLSCGA